jgi:WD40 repeat protein
VTNFGILQRWDLTTGKPMFHSGPDDGLTTPVERLAFTPDGRELVAAGWGQQTARWNIRSGKLLGVIAGRLGHTFVTTPAGIRAVNTAPELISTPSRPGGISELTVFDAVAGKPLTTVAWSEPEQVGVNGLRSYALTADGRTLLVASGDEPAAVNTSSVTACDVATGRRLARFDVPGYLGFANSPFSPCGRWVVLAGKVYHLGTGTELFAPAAEPTERLLFGQWPQSYPVWFSPDGRYLAGRLARIDGDKRVPTDVLAIWELASGRVFARYPRSHFVFDVAFSPDGRTLAVVDGWGVRIRDLLTGEQVATYAAPDIACDQTDRGCATQPIAYAPDGRVLATGHRDGTVILWHVPQRVDADEKPPAKAELDAAWVGLGSDSPSIALVAIRRLVTRPGTATELLTTKYRNAVPPDDPEIRTLVRRLGDDSFATREAAMRRLRELGVKAVSALRRALAENPSAEFKRRIEELLTGIAPPVMRLPVAGDSLRDVRAVEVLERIGTENARQLLRLLAGGPADARLTQEARAALDRVGATKDWK